MSSIEKRLAAFSKLPLRAQLALIASTRNNPILSQNKEYIESLERIHTECLSASTLEEKAIYEQSKDNLTQS